MLINISWIHDCILAPLAGPYADDLLHGIDEQESVPGLTGIGGIKYRLDRFIEVAIAQDDVYLYLEFVRGSNVRPEGEGESYKDS